MTPASFFIGSKGCGKRPNMKPPKKKHASKGVTKFPRSRTLPHRTKRTSGEREKSAERVRKTNDELMKWKSDVQSWQEDVVTPLAKIAAPDEVMDFEVLGTYSSRAAGGFNDEHNRELAQLWERLERLKRVIKRLGRR